MKIESIIPSWSARFQVYTLPNRSIFLLSQAEQFYFSFDQYPLLSEIDGVKSVEAITNLAQTPFQRARFCQVIESFLSDPTCNFFSKEIGYRTIGECRNVKRHQNNNVIDCIESKLIPELSLWIEALSLSIFYKYPLKIVIVRDFLDGTISDVVRVLAEPFFLMCFQEQAVHLSPLLVFEKPANHGLDSAIALNEFQSTLLNNNPVHQFLMRLLKRDAIGAPIKIPNFESLSPLIVTQLLNWLAEHIACRSDQQAVMNLGGNLEYHAITGINSTCKNEFFDQILSPVELQSCMAIFDADGGSRHLNPAATLENLEKLISPLTGVIANLRELKTNDQNPIKVYRSTFYKTPSLHDLETLDDSSFIQSCLGKGVTLEQAKVSALGEAIERKFAQFVGNEPRLFAFPKLLEKRFYTFQQLTPYSANQYAQFQNKKNPDSKRKQAAQEYRNEEIHWIPTWSLSKNEQVFVPLTTCFANTPFAEDRFGRWHSNGCAAGNTLEEAVLQALFELIERDATSIWWYNQISRPEFDLIRINPEYFDLLKTSLGVSHNFWVLDLTHDIGVPVMAAIGRNKNSSGFSFGFGCHLKPELAAQRALTELCQLIPIRDQRNATFNFNSVIANESLFPCDKNRTPAATLLDYDQDIKQNIDRIVQRLDSLGLESLVLNYSRTITSIEAPLKTAKVFVPGLCHIWPQFANERLYQVPVKLGWRTQAYGEAELNPLSLYI